MERVVVLRGYPKINADGKMRNWDAVNSGWWIEEKMDGSQLSFFAEGGSFVFQNRGKTINKEAPGWVFEAAMSALSTLYGKLPLELVYHGECIVKPKHNVVRYGRVPRFYFVLFDAQSIETGEYVWPNDLQHIASEAGLERAPILYMNKDAAVQPSAKVDELIEAMRPGSSLLGGEDMPEGVVIKHHAYRKPNHKVAATKIKVVRAEFKEEHKCPSKKVGALPQVVTAEESLERIMSWFPKEARWQKARQRLRDQGKITGEEERAADERNAIREEARRDFKEECKETLKSLLWAEFGQRLTQSITDGL